MIFDPQLFHHHAPETQVIRDVSDQRSNDLGENKNVQVRVGIAGILEGAEDQWYHGLGANFGIKNAGLPAILESDIDISDGDTLRSTLKSARGEMMHDADRLPTTLLKCIA